MYVITHWYPVEVLVHCYSVRVSIIVSYCDVQCWLSHCHRLDNLKEKMSVARCAIVLSLLL